MLNYKAIEIFTSEEARHLNQPMAEAVIKYIRDLKIAARCIVTRGIAGCYESGEVSTGKIEILSFNLPIRIYIVLPAAETERVLSGVNEIVGDGIVALHDLTVVGHKAHNTFFPRHLLVRDVMSPNPKSVTEESSLSEVVGLLLSSIFTGLPVVDSRGCPVGVITQGDLIDKGGLPLRVGLLSESDKDCVEPIMNRLASRKAVEVMTTPVITIGDERPLFEAVDMMLENKVKRLPVVDKTGRLAGMLSRLDIFRTVMREAPDWHAFKAQKIDVKNLRTVSGILRRDTHAVSPEAGMDEVIRVIDHNDIQRVAVVDEAGKLLGLISDRDLLHYFKEEQGGFISLFAKIKHPFKKDFNAGDLDRRLSSTKAADVMNTELITVREEMLIGEAIGLMTEKALKRLPVVDEAGCFKGMISRDSLLRTGFGQAV